MPQVHCPQHLSRSKKLHAKSSLLNGIGACLGVSLCDTIQGILIHTIEDKMHTASDESEQPQRFATGKIDKAWFLCPNCEEYLVLTRQDRLIKTCKGCRRVWNIQWSIGQAIPGKHHGMPVLTLRGDGADDS